MNTANYNEIIKTARKAKGLTQQELAEQAGISLRTVQRIEKGTEEISGYSLRQMSNVLDIPLEQIIMQTVDQLSIDTNQIGRIKSLYISSFTLLINPLLGLIVPLIIGYNKQNKNELYKMNLKNIVKFNLIGLLFYFLIFLFVVSRIVSELPRFPASSNSSLIFLTPLLYYLFMVIFICYNYFKLNKIS